ncbi:hypothetical protein B0A48_12111 [Cryoendolithus antarcticus]|uniref:Heterokaryon incompatibility domain-containing protein n=1 Tax=Cryoendolithus antarcticus TaxID=1507870 RepID=A0A1V8STT7_9PEZI|nr:hypothetical protein B0A48_12111 [Cryoendolithus antarcticus]
MSNRRQIRFSPIDGKYIPLTGLISALEPTDPAVPAIEWLLDLRDKSKRVFAVTNQGDPALDFSDAIRAVRRIGFNTASHESIETARAWIRSCVEGHPGQHRTYSDAGLYRNSPGMEEQARDDGPTHLIDCSSDCLLNNEAFGKGSRLVDGSVRPGPYAALSYRWGTADSASWVTTEDNIAARQIQLPETSLPKTIRDAIQITRALDIRYLWIDAICINQSSKDAWLTESSKMAAVFENALVTICASTSTGSTEGMLNARSVDGIESAAEANGDTITIQSVLKSGASSTLHLQFSSGTDRPYRMTACLPAALTWVFEPGTPVKQICVYTAPSWSWASQPRAVTFTHAFSHKREAEYECKLLEADMHLAGRDEFGAVTSGRLMLRSKMWDVRFVPHEICQQDCERSHEVFLDGKMFLAYYDNGFSSLQHSSLMAVSTFFAKPEPWGGGRFEVCDFLLVQKTDEPTLYRRVGVCTHLSFSRMHKHTNEDYLATRHDCLTAMFAAKAETSITLT